MSNVDLVSKLVVFFALTRSFKKDRGAVHRVTANDNEWQRVVQRMITNDNEW